MTPHRLSAGALAGAVAAAAWAAQQPLDRRLFGVPYDDTELLGKAVTQGSSWPWVGALLHIGNGAALGALYSGMLKSRLPGPAPALVLALAEHLGTWPLTRFVNRWHPAGDELPVLWGDHRAFAQASWRHVLFGVVLGLVEQRLSPPAPPDPPWPMSSNGSGDLEAAIRSRAVPD